MRVLLFYFLFLLFHLGNGHLSAQNASNPFELKHRIPKTNLDATKDTIVDTRLIKTNNPFDIANQPVAKAVLPRTTPTKESKEKSPTTSNYLFWAFFILFTFFTSVVALSRKKLEQSYQAVFNDNYLRQLHRANQGNFSLGYLLLYILFFLNVGIFIYLTANYFGANLPKNMITIFLVCLGVGLAFLFKHALLYFIENVFPISKEIKLYSFTIMVFSIILGIVLLPLNTMIAFAPENLARLAIWGGFGAILATYFIRSLRGLSIGSRFLMLHSFHFLLYLCAVEIIPVIILVKFILLRIN